MLRSKGLRILAFALVATMLVSMLSVAFAAYDTLTYGEQSDAVRKMQKALKSKGYFPGAVDGKFGPATKTAVRKYQAAIGLHADGKPGNRTLTALYEGRTTLNKANDTELKNSLNIKNPRSLYYGCTGARVRGLQRALKTLGYFKGIVDGVYGDLTRAAVKRYQRAHGLTSDGIAGVKTVAKLNAAQKYKIAGGMILDEGSTGVEVKNLQQYLDSKGFTNTDEAGVYGASTREAVRVWQESMGQTETGAVTENAYNRYVVQ